MILYCPNKECTDQFSYKLIKDDDLFFVRCENCKTFGKKYSNKKDAIDAWNKMKREPINTQNIEEISFDLEDNVVKALEIQSKSFDITLNDYIVNLLVLSARKELSE